MIQTAPKTGLLGSIADAVAGIGAFAVQRDGACERLGGQDGQLQVDTRGRLAAGPGRGVVAGTMADGVRVALTFPADEASRFEPWLRGTLELIAQHQQLETDMESMNHSATQLLEQVAMLGETLPKLSSGETDAEIAEIGLRACLVAAGVERALFLSLHPRSGMLEVLVHLVQRPGGRVDLVPAANQELVSAQRGLLADLLAAGDGVVLRDVPAGGFGDAAAPEALARREVLGVRVAYDAGDENVSLGAMLLFDRIDDEQPPPGRLPGFGSEEVQVASSFGSMLGAVLGARITAELGKELSLAQAIQAQILPVRPMLVPGFELAGDYRTSGEVGGDYFDYVPLADGRTLAVVADVSGHNLASGMMMVSARATLRTLAAVRSSPAQVFDDLAASMYQDLIRTERFLTAAAVALRPGDGQVELVNAGHNELMLCRAASGRVERLPAMQTILGFVPHPGYQIESVRLHTGDVLLLYTDGVTEAMDTAGEMFGEDRLAQALANAAPRGARGVVEAVLSAVEAFRNPRLRTDDVTVVAIRAVGPWRSP